MSNLSELLPAGAGAKSADFVASGTLGSGQTVTLRSDGKVEAVSETSQSNGTATAFETDQASSLTSCYDTVNDKVIIAYRDEGNSSYGTSRVGTVSGTSISFGTPVIFNSGTTTFCDSAYDVNSGKTVIVYRDVSNSSRGTAVVGTVSGTSISFGSEYVFNTGITADPAIVYDSNAQKVLIAYMDFSNTYQGTAVVGTVSGTTISFGSEYLFNPGGYDEDIACVYDPVAQKNIILWRDANTNVGKAITATISGTTVSYGTAVTVEAAPNMGDFNAATYDVQAGKSVLIFKVGNTIAARTAEISGTDITLGSKATSSFTGDYIRADYSVVSNSHIIAFANTSTAYGSTLPLSVSGSSLTFGTVNNFYTSAGVNATNATYDPDTEKTIILYGEGATPYAGYAFVYTAYSNNSADFIGITDQAIADTATGAVIVQGGVSDKVTGLTTGSDYYIQTDGSLSTTVSSVPAGRALSSTSILLEG
jgi:hypothetical protein